MNATTPGKPRKIQAAVRHFGMKNFFMQCPKIFPSHTTNIFVRDRRIKRDYVGLLGRVFILGIVLCSRTELVHRPYLEL